MNTLSIPPHVVQSVGWTLVHSIWQVLVVFAILKLATRLIPVAQSTVRYALSVVAMAIAVAAPIVTFFLLYEVPSSNSVFTALSITTPITETATSSSWLAAVSYWVDANTIWLIRFWFVGFVISLARVAMGLWYIDHLRKNSAPVDRQWQDLIESLLDRLNIQRSVSVAETGITSPMVVGFIKPMILFPVGLLTGLTAVQIETILVHELSHIRRQDYLINLIQAFVESVFFYNPFMLLISAQIREERENCCDDVVIAHGANPMDYVKTLAQIEASRSSTLLAVGFASNKNQLLNRIKRIMEKSAENNWGKGRFIPLALLLVGFICASWLSIGSERNASEEHLVLAADTAKPKMQTLHSSKRRKSEPTKPKEEVDATREVVIIPDETPEIPDWDSEAFDEPGIPMIAGPNGLLDDLAFERFRFSFDPNLTDSLPSQHFKMRLDGEDFAMFQEEFMKRFHEQFKDFYEKNQEQLNQIIEDARRRQRDAAEIVDLDLLRNKAEFEAEEMARLSDMVNRSFPKEEMEEVMRQSEKMKYEITFRDKAALETFKATLDAMDEMPRISADQLRHDAELARSMAEANRAMSEDMKRTNEGFTAEFSKMLAEDGYIKKGEKLKEININDDGKTFTVNGHKIKEKDAVKYRALYDQFLGKWQEKPRERYRKPE